MSGRFYFRAHEEFRHTDCTVLNNRITGLEVDLSGVEDLDSSVLSILLLRKENAGKSEQSITLLIVRERYGMFLKSQTSINSSDKAEPLKTERTSVREDYGSLSVGLVVELRGSDLWITL